MSAAVHRPRQRWAARRRRTLRKRRQAQVREAGPHHCVAAAACWRGLSAACGKAHLRGTKGCARWSKRAQRVGTRGRESRVGGVQTWVIQDGVVPEQGARRELQRPRAARRVKHLPQRRRSAARQVHSAAAGELQSSRRLCSVRQHGRAHAVGASSCSPHGHQRVEGGRGGEERRRLQAQCGRVDEARVRCLVAASAARRARIASHRGGIASGSLHTAVRCPACQSRVCQPRHICACAAPGSGVSSPLWRAGAEAAGAVASSGVRVPAS